MAEAKSEQRGFDGSSHFWIRRLHSLSGIIPVGVFLTFHLSVNAMMALARDGSAFQTAVNAIHAMHKLGILKFVEIVGIFVPLAFHAVVGVLIWLSGRQNVLTYRYGANIRYTLQRWTALITLAFVLFHVWHMHWLGAWWPPGGQNFDPDFAPYTAARAIQASGWLVPIYAVGVLAAVYHFSNGIWTFLIVWGIPISRQAQARAGYVCTVIGLGLATLGMASLLRLARADLADFPTPPEKSIPGALVLSNGQT
ncbi:MAG: succinate dehydrogenase [Phycisphaerae bacterium]|nr:succinate dehydrogenase [Phycisphaerae bacterium]